MILVVTDSQGFTCKLFCYWEHLKVKDRKSLCIHNVYKKHETHNKHLEKMIYKVSHFQTHCSKQVIKIYVSVTKNKWKVPRNNFWICGVLRTKYWFERNVKFKRIHVNMLGRHISLGSRLLTTKIAFENRSWNPNK